MSKRKDQEISIEYKYHVIKRFEIKEATHDQIAQDIGVARCSITRWYCVQRKAIIKANEGSFCSGARKRISSSTMNFATLRRTRTAPYRTKTLRPRIL